MNIHQYIDKAIYVPSALESNEAEKVRDYCLEIEKGAPIVAIACAALALFALAYSSFLIGGALLFATVLSYEISIVYSHIREVAETRIDPKNEGLLTYACRKVGNVVDTGHSIYKGARLELAEKICKGTFFAKKIFSFIEKKRSPYRN